MSFLEALESYHEEWAGEIEERSADRFQNLELATRLWMDDWPNQPSQTDRLRASGIHFVCPREFVLNYWQPQPNKVFDWKSQLMMSTGTHLHSYLQNCVLGPLGVLSGKWCRYAFGEVDELVRGTHPDPHKALFEIQHQRPLTWHYEEDRVWDEQHRIAGHLDGKISLGRIAHLWDNRDFLKEGTAAVCGTMLDVPIGETVLLEIKTVGGWTWEKLKAGAPKGIAEYYRTQAAVYGALDGCRQTLFWYVNRDTMQSRLLLYEHELGWWREAKRKARIIWESIRDETLPESMMACKTPKDRRGKSCVFHGPCWDRRFDFSQWVADGKRMAAESERELLDLSEWTADDETDC